MSQSEFRLQFCFIPYKLETIRMSKMLRLSAVIFLSLVLLGCANQFARNANKDRGATPNEKISVYKYEVFFGLSIPDGGTVSSGEWELFRSKTIASTFPNGFTIYDASGSYKGKTEQSKVLTLIVDSDNADLNRAKIKKVAREYVNKFGQESVMMTKVPVIDWDFIRTE